MQLSPSRARTVLVAALVTLSLLAVAPAASAVPTDVYAQTGADDEPNDGVENATAADTDRAINGEIGSEEDVDYYAISLREGSQVEISQGIGSSEITMTLLDENGDVVASRPPQDVYEGDEDLLIANTSATGTYYLKVEGNSGDEYSIGVGVTEPDDYEPNDDVEGAASIESGEAITGTIVRGDTDVFAVDADAGQRITVNATSTAPLIATLYAPGGDVIESSPVYDEDSEAILEDPSVRTVASIDAETNGTYFVEIEHDPSYLGNINGPYELSVTTSGDASASDATDTTTDESASDSTDGSATETTDSESDAASTTDDATASGSGTDADSGESTTATGTTNTAETANTESTANDGNDATTTAGGETSANAEPTAAAEDTTATPATEATTDAPGTDPGTATGSDGDVSEDVEQTAVNGPGFGIVAALVALFGAALLATRRS